ncbi:MULTISPECIES: hypothetical protein [unclassified Candidatus Frackibacter]|uniref:hypothetical protein n=1 Tax=unclassified Candidatus Frackibacter TaxID=2648818 RepID=UPI000889FAFC|nr:MULTISPECIES: hypothetical protein [unclassified Candidatus Frackibacter]SDC18415.1 hypothetical protein SAMN04515661_103130 [Candidatus Frackibacter sp. WG11]SEM43841.1 hypothetical protein SAMN04488698_10410 [Candidatus Frackibacter sp. WG12]SFL46242.1 hypothetical protein SAMN04488699_10310 [Candidatus Frackibacter sp. WG13]
MKKVVIGVTVLALVLSMAVMVMAKEGNDNWFQKNYQFQKDYINQQLERGLITEQQAEYMLERLETMKEYYEEHGDELDNRGNGAYRMPCGMSGPGMMGGAGFGPMMHGPGMMRGYGQGPGMMGGYGPGMM